MTKLEAKYLRVYPCKEIKSVDGFIKEVEIVKNEWSEKGNRLQGNEIPWFRGQRNCEKPPIPSVFREYDNENKKRYSLEDEFNLVTTFRNRAQALGPTPESNRIDQWLFLMQHYKLPTRLLDWTESSLIALFFALYQLPETMKKDWTNPCVWMLNPIELNKMTKVTVNMKPKKEKELDVFPNTWTPNNIGSLNFQFAFRGTSESTIYPIAIQPTYIQNRIIAQKSVFTIHGSKEDDFEKIFKDNKKEEYLRKFIIDKNNAVDIFNVLKTLGITCSTVFPDFEGLANELRDRFKQQEE